jgi:hypothetical protein
MPYVLMPTMLTKGRASMYEVVITLWIRAQGVLYVFDAALKGACLDRAVTNGLESGDRTVSQGLVDLLIDTCRS